MATSSLTKLQALNLILDQIAEPQVTTSGQSTASRKANAALLSALVKVQSLYDWTWLKATIGGNIPTWSLEKATFLSVRKFEYIKWLTAAGQYINIPYANWEQFYLGTIQELGENGVPSYWTFRDNKVAFKPYPTTSDTRGQLFIDVISEPAPPLTDINVFGLPDRFLYVVIDEALYNLHVTHVHDMESAQFYQRKYQDEIYRLKNQEPGMHTGQMSMFGNR